MDFDLWEKVLWYTNNIKYYVPQKALLSDKILFKKVSEKFIVNKFLETWLNYDHKDPSDILYDMILKYSIWRCNALNNNNDKLFNIYESYVKTLTGLKNFIEKEKNNGL